MENYFSRLAEKVYAKFSEFYENSLGQENRLIPVYVISGSHEIADASKLENYAYLFPDSRQKAQDKKRVEKDCKKSKIVIDKNGKKHIHKKRNGSR